MVWRGCSLYFISHSLPILEGIAQSPVCTTMCICSPYLAPQILLFLSVVVPLFSLFRLQTEILKSCHAVHQNILLALPPSDVQNRNRFSTHLWFLPLPWSPFLLLIIIVVLYFPVPTKNLFSGVKVRYF